MKISSPTNPKPREPKSILLIGPPGSGKTSLMLGFPKLRVLDLERNLDGAEIVNRKRDTNLTYEYEEVYKNEKGELLAIEDWFDRLLQCIDACKVSDRETVGVDNLTDVNEAIIRKVLKQQRRDVMEGRDWQPFKSHFLQLLIGKLRSLGRTTICTGHEQAIERSDPANMMNKIITGYESNVQGKVGDGIAGFFTDCWRTTAVLGAGNKMSYILQTSAIPLCRFLKNSCGMPNEIDFTNKGYDAIKQYL